MADTLRLEIISPAGIIYRNDVRHVQAPGEEGYFGVLHGHTPLIAALTVGQITADLPGGGQDLFATSGGVAEVHPDSVVILAETAEERAKIDVSRAEEAAVRSRQRLESEDAAIDHERARGSLARALNRVKVARGV